ncbi:MAG: 50S ribosomal protein L31e [Candidatus Anstonellales archaeon]
MEGNERVYTVPLGDAFVKPRNKRTPRAVKLLREFAARHMKTDVENVIISNMVNAFIWMRGIQKPPRKVKVKMLAKDGKVYVLMMDEKLEEKVKEEKKEERKEEKKEAPKEEKKEEKAEEKEEEKKKAPKHNWEKKGKNK